MSKQGKTYILLVVVLGIWGFLGFKVVSFIGEEDSEVAVLVNPTTPILEEPLERETIVIQADYRDPFLDKPYIKKVKKAQKRKAPTKKPEPPKMQISYSGMVGEAGSSDRLFFVTISGQQHLMSLKDQVQEVQLVWGNKDSIRVQYSGHKEYIRLQ